jgi:hypothetical protein
MTWRAIGLAADAHHVTAVRFKERGFNMRWMTWREISARPSQSAASIRSVLKKSGVPLARPDGGGGAPVMGAPVHYGETGRGGGHGGGGWGEQRGGGEGDYHVPSGMVNGSDILFRNRAASKYVGDALDAPAQAR